MGYKLKEITEIREANGGSPWTKGFWYTVGVVAAAIGFTYLFVERVNASELDAVVKIDQSCSGTIVSSEKRNNEIETQILTAKHCVDKNGGQLNIEFTDRGKPVYDKNVYYDVLRKDFKSDLALITLRDNETVYPVIKIAEKLTVDFGDTVYAVGYPLGLIKTITNGTYNGYQYYKDHSYIRASAAVTFGNSGGALLQKNENGFEQIGVTSMKANGSEFLNFFVPLKEIREFLRLSETKAEIFLPPLPKLDEYDSNE